MSQITRCPFCSTTFKVVADQLRISDGWVRCGQCKQVFDASEHLWVPDLAPLLPEMQLGDLGAPTPAAEGMFDRVVEQADTPEPQPPNSPILESSGSENLAALSSLLKREALVEPDAVPKNEIQGYELPCAALGDSAWPEEFDADMSADPGDASEAEPEPDARNSPSSDEEVQVTAQPVLLPPEPLEPLEQESVLVEGAAIMPGAAHDGDARAETAPSPEEPGFVKTARRGAFWRRPAVHGALALAGLILFLILGLQMAVHERDAIAARNPAARALLERLCVPLQCALQAPQRIAAVVIDSSSFLKERNDAAAYRLQMSLKNGSALTVAMPAVELTLTDALDKTILRRVLLRDDLGAPAELAPGSTWSGTVAMQITQEADQVAGYRLLAFYP